uniref:ATPase MORC2 chromo domain-containing protein n=1 Tax=Ciona savignyi TaxID=51511 RepID=H2YNH0_CIOSA
MEKMQRELDKVSKLQTVTSSRDAFNKLSNESRRRKVSSSSSGGEVSDGDEMYSPTRPQLTQDSRMSSTSDGYKRRPVDDRKTVARKSAAYTPTKNSNFVIPKKKSRVEPEEPSDDSDDDSSKSTHIGRMVELNIGGKYRPGRIILSKVTKGQPTKFKIKFDQHPQDRFDKWVEENSIDLRFVTNSGFVTNGNTAPSPTKRRASAPEASSSVQIDQTTADLQENALGKLRTCLRYFLPPQWKMPKEQINNLSLQELVDFPMDDFFDHYEKGLRRLVSNFRTQADQQRAAADTAKQELSETQQLLFDLLTRFDKDTPPMANEEVTLYARRYLDNTT